MKIQYTVFVTFIALVAIFFLQGVWIFNIYKLVEVDFKKSMSTLFLTSVEKETALRLDDPTKKEEREGKVMGPFPFENDNYAINRTFQDFLYTEDYPISLEKVDSIFKEEGKNHYENLEYSFIIIDSLGIQTAEINHIKNMLNKQLAYKETIQLRNIAPEYLTLTISSPYKIVFGEMLLMLIGSILLAIVVVSCLIYQIGIIIKQKKIATLRQDFTHAMIHDMKNPIASIHTGVRSLRTGKIDDKPQLKTYFYDIIIQESERLHKLTNKILEIAKFEDKRATLSKEWINLSDLLEELTKKHTLNATKTVNFQITLNEVEYIFADPYYMLESFDNLLDNAIKYSKENEDAEISITACKINNETQIVFKDNGIGISVKDQKKIFKKFERAMSVIKSQKKISGFGLGLNFVNQVIKAHDGTISINSRIGYFSEFIINLPYNENDKTIID